MTPNEQNVIDARDLVSRAYGLLCAVELDEPWMSEVEDARSDLATAFGKLNHTTGHAPGGRLTP